MDAVDPDGPAKPDSGIYGLTATEQEARVVLLPVPFEATVSYRSGASLGPELILHASHQIDLFDSETGRPYEHGIHMRALPDNIRRLGLEAKTAVHRMSTETWSHKKRIEAIEKVNEAGVQVNAHVYKETKALLAQGKIVGVVGGDHSVPFGSIQAHAEHFREIGVLQLDAHADLRVAYEGFVWSHASIMERVLSEVPGVTKLVQVAVRDLCEAEVHMIESTPTRIATYFDAGIAEARMEARLLQHFREIVQELPQDVYLSFDIDGLNPSLCPGTGTPVPGGLDLGETSALLKLLVASKRRIVGFDLTEVASQDPADEWNGNVGARLLYKMIGWALRSQHPQR